MAAATISTCTACGEVFRSVEGFDLHRIGHYGESITSKTGRFLGYSKHTRRCLSTDEILALGMRKDERGRWMMPERVKPLNTDTQAAD